MVKKIYKFLQKNSSSVYLLAAKMDTGFKLKFVEAPSRAYQENLPDEMNVAQTIMKPGYYIYVCV